LSDLPDDYERYWIGVICHGDLVREAGTWYDTETDRLARQWVGRYVEECDQVEAAARIIEQTRKMR
jgi:hypothetical protein